MSGGCTDGSRVYDVKMMYLLYFILLYNGGVGRKCVASVLLYYNFFVILSKKVERTMTEVECTV